MNQSASPARRPSGSTATAGCCPMLLHPQFFVNTFSAQAPLPPPPPTQQCPLVAQSAQQQMPSTQASQPNNTAGLTNTAGQQQQQQQPLQASRQDHSNYNTSILAHGLSLHHLLANRHSATNCMALAAALASASFHQHQQLHHAHHQHQQQQTQPTPITNHSHPPTNVVSTPINNQTSTTSQVPLLNFNSYTVAQPFLNLTTPPAPIAAHLNLSNNHHQHQPTNVAPDTSNITPSLNSVGGQPVSQQSNHRPLATNTTLNSVANQPTQQQINYRTAPPPPPPIQQQQPNRNLLSDETLNSIFNEHFQAILLNQLFANNQFAPSVAPSAPQIGTTRHISPPLPNGPQPNVPTEQISSAPPNQQNHTNITGNEQPPERSSSFQSVPQAQAQPRMAQAPSMDNFSPPSGVGLYQQQHTGPASHQAGQQPQESVPVQAQQQSQQPQPIPPLPFYSFPQMEQALALLTNPQVANNLFSHVFNIYLQGGLRTEPHHLHHHHHPPHHYHHHLHGSHHHHHHHHSPNGQNNVQDDTMLTISESKPRGLNRAEIDSLTPYIQMNEKDSRTCVICLSKFELKTKIRPLPCNHAFHAKCVDKWLRANRTCPICRRDALKTFGAKIKRI